MLLKIIFQKQIHILDLKHPQMSQIDSYITRTFKSRPLHYCLYYLDEDQDKISIIDDKDLQVLLQQNVRSVKIYLEEALLSQVEEIKIEELNEKDEKLNSLHVGSEQEQKENQVVQQPYFQAIHYQEAQYKIQSVQKQEKIITKYQEQEQEEIAIIHNAKCDNCGVSPILNIRYKCGVCQNYDICLACEQKILHDHPLIKIRHPCQLPLSIEMKFPQVIIAKKAIIKRQQFKFETEGERQLIILSYLSSLFGPEYEERYTYFAKRCKQNTYEGVMEEFMKLINGQNQPKLPGLFGFIQQMFNRFRIHELNPFRRQ